MDNIILGLLLLQSRTIYQLRERIEKGLHLMYSSSMGSIQAAIKKLLKYGYIRYDETVENGKYKKIYSITDDGRQYFAEWINAPMDEQCAKNPELAKVYFMGFADKACRTETIRKHLSCLREQYHALALICQEAENIEFSAEHKDVFIYQAAAARYGRDFIQFNIEWYENLLKQAAEL